MPRTSSIDAGWDSVENETVPPLLDSEIPESGIRQSDAAIDHQTLRPGVVPTFMPSVRIFEAPTDINANHARPISRRILEGAIIFSIGIACGIGLHARVIPLIEHTIEHIESARSIQSLPVTTQSPNSIEASDRHSRAPRQQQNLEASATERRPETSRTEEEPNTINSIGKPINSVSNSGTKEIVQVTNPLTVSPPKTQSVAVRHRPIIRRSKIVASDNPY